MLNPAAAHHCDAGFVDDITLGGDQDSVGMLVERGNLLSQTGRVEDVIATDQLDEFTPGPLGDRVPVGQRSPAARQTHQFDPEVRRDRLKTFPRPVRGTAVSYTHLTLPTKR